MFDNIGGKIKTLAHILCWVGIVSCLITGIALMVADSDLLLAGLLTMIGGSLFSWVSSFVLYGFGQMIENSDTIIQQNQTICDTMKNVQSNVQSSENEIIICPECGFEQYSDRTVCWKCGTKL